MAPALSGDWRSETEAAAAAPGGAAWPQSEQLVPVVSLSVLVGSLLVSVLLLLCASCKGQKKSANLRPVGDQENLVNGVSERETISQSAESPLTDAAVSTSHNGPLTSGTILTDTQDTSPQLSEEVLFSQSELRSSKYHQDRELPSIPPNTAHIEDRPPASGDNTYEMVKDIATASRDVSVEDSLYETVKELKEPPAQSLLSNGTVQPSPDDPQPPLLLNGHLSPGTPCTPERGPLYPGVEYASIDLNKKSRHSADMEAKRHSGNVSGPAPSHKPLEEPEEDLAPPVPEKVLNESDHQPVVMNGLSGAGLHNGELHSPLSAAPEFNNHSLSDSESAVYSVVNKTNCDNAAADDEDKEHDYSSIAEIKGLVPASSSSDLYATVRDIQEPQPGDDAFLDGTDPGYESIRIPKTSSSDDDYRGEAEGADVARAEHDYESLAELGLGRDVSRL